MTEQEKQQLVEAVITQLKRDGTDVSKATVVSGADGIAYVLCYDNNNNIVRVTPSTFDGITEVTWEQSSHVDDYIEAGVYDIAGTRWRNDGLPINNMGENATIAAKLFVTVTPEGATTYRHSIGQTLILTNAEGKETKVYTRNGNRTSTDGGVTYTITWGNWGQLQQNIEVGLVASLDSFTNNGIYSGIWQRGEEFITFVCVVINDYALGVSPRRVSQYVYGINKGSGKIEHITRMAEGDTTVEWERDWHVLNEQYISDAVEGIYVDIQTMQEDIVAEFTKVKDSVSETKKDIANQLSVTPDADKVTITGRNEQSMRINFEANIPAATTENAGVISAEDKKNIGYSAKNAVAYCTDRLINAYIKELYISGENAKAQGFYVERIIKNANNTCVCAIYSADKSLMFYIESAESIPYKYWKVTKNGFTLETIINFEKVTEKWGDHVCDAESGKLLPWSFNIESSPCIKAIHLNEEKTLEIKSLNNELSKLGASVSVADVIAIKGKYLQNNGKISTDYADGYYSDYYPVMSSNRVRYSGSASGNVAAWAFYDSDKNFLSAYPASNPSSAITLDTVVDDIPEDARYIRFGSVYSVFTAEILPADVLVKKDLLDVEANIAKNTSDIADMNAKLSDFGISVSTGQYINIANGNTYASAAAQYTEKHYRISPTDKILYSGQYGLSAAAWAFYDKDKKFISAYPASSPAEPVVLENKLIDNIPENAAFIRFGSLAADLKVGYLNAVKRDEYEQFKELSLRNPLFGKSVDWIGASHMQGIVSGVKTGGFATIISSRNSMVSNNYGIGGTTMAVRADRTNSFVERIETYSKDVDYVIVMGGANDTVSVPLGAITTGYDAELDKTTFYGACEWMCRYIMENYSEKKYGLIVPFHIASTALSGEWGDAIVAVCKKWGMPCLDLRKEAGFNIASVALRKIYGAYVGDVAEYDTTAGYELDAQVKYQGALYKADAVIPAPAGDFDADKWTLQGSDSTSDYDNWHCNVLGYRKLADVVEAWLRTL